MPSLQFHLTPKREAVLILTRAGVALPALTLGGKRVPVHRVSAAPCCLCAGRGVINGHNEFGDADSRPCPQCQKGQR